MRNIWLFSLALSVLVIGCTSGENAKGGTTAVAAGDGFSTIDVPGSKVKRLVKTNEVNVVEEEGFVLDSLRQGAWITYYPNSYFPEKITHFVDGKANGPYFEFNERGQMTLQAHYKDNKLDGYWAKYRFGRPTMEAGYVNGQLHGAVLEYDISSGDLQKEMNYKMGVMDGPYRFYNDGQVTIEYLYKNGKKVSGGAIEPTDNSPR